MRLIDADDMKTDVINQLAFISLFGGEFAELAEILKKGILEEIEKAPTIDAVPAWIPVTERLPEDGAAVNVTWVNHSPSIYYQHLKDKPQTATGVYCRRKWYWWSNVVQDYLAEYGEWGFDEMDDAIEVTHWMPIPEPPKEERR